ncbi:hypothetical protein [Erythrobacter oryzae]|uniref:hypothetical protein n=1 Tax=Erythrobacter oryzae TaxID=3019556 RepID=UPI0025530604|nr:hypothetical protein [Erythrobacter sp. COR-2]
MIAQLAPGHDVVALPVPLGIRLRDTATARFVGSGVDVGVERAVAAARRHVLAPTPSGHWVNQGVLGELRSLPADPAAWPANRRAFRIAVDDPSGQYLPLRLVGDLPVNGTLVWGGWPALPAADYGPLMPAGAAQGFKPAWLPLFPSSAYSAGPLARVHAHLALRDPATGALVDAAWALVKVSLGARVIGLGLADAGGAVGVFFPYPLLPDLTPQQKTQGRPVAGWDVTIAVHCTGLGKPGDAAVVPDLAAILAQLAQPARRALRTTAAALPALGVQRLLLGTPLVLRSESPPGTRKSSLYLNNP